MSPSAFSRRAVVSYWRKYVHEVLVNRLGGLSLPRKSVVSLTDRPDMTLDVYRGRKTTMQQLESASMLYTLSQCAILCLCVVYSLHILYSPGPLACCILRVSVKYSSSSNTVPSSMTILYSWCLYCVLCVGRSKGYTLGAYDILSFRASVCCCC